MEILCTCDGCDYRVPAWGWQGSRKGFLLDVKLAAHPVKGWEHVCVLDLWLREGMCSSSCCVHMCVRACFYCHVSEGAGPGWQPRRLGEEAVGGFRF